MIQLITALTGLWLLASCASATVGSAETSEVPYARSVAALHYGELAATFSTKSLDEVLQGQLANQVDSNRRAAATLILLGALNPADLGNPELARRKIEHFSKVLLEPHGDLLGRVGDASLHHRLAQPLDWSELLSAQHVLEVLGEALSDGVITGYDLRKQGVYDDLPKAHSFIYSHQDSDHLRQLVALLQRENIQAWVFRTPKVSAFLYREDWGGDGENLVTLPSGVKVVQGREMAVAFQFATPDDRRRFHAVIEAYAKRDSEDESGLIKSSWWQPFYYTDEALDGFEPISLLVLSDGMFEATLTVVEGRSKLVREALQGSLARIREDRVWVNPAFFRFLNGDYK